MLSPHVLSTTLLKRLKKKACFSATLEVLPALLLDSAFCNGPAVTSQATPLWLPRLSPSLPALPRHRPRFLSPTDPATVPSCQAVGVTSVSALSTDQWRQLQLQLQSSSSSQPQRRKSWGLGRGRTDLVQLAGTDPPLAPQSTRPYPILQQCCSLHLHPIRVLLLQLLFAPPPGRRCP